MADALTKEDGTAQEKLRRILAQGEWKYQEGRDFVAGKKLPKEDMVNLVYEQEHINHEVAWFSRAIRNMGLAHISGKDFSQRILQPVEIMVKLVMSVS